MIRTLTFLFVAFFLGFFCSCNKQAESTHGEGVEFQKTGFAESWPLFHGNPQLDGRAKGFLPDTLKLAWRFKANGPVVSSAAIDQGRVYVGSDDGNLYALDLEKGTEIWRFKTNDMVESSPCVVKDTVFTGSTDGFLYALATEDGALRWKQETGAKILGGVNFFLPEGDDKARVLAGSYDNNLYCFDAKTGEELWVYESDSYINGMPAVAKGLAIFGGCDAVIHFVSIMDGGLHARVEAGSYIAGSAVCDNDLVYVGQYEGEFLCVDGAAEKVNWRYLGEDAFFSTATLSEDYVIFGGRDWNLHCVRRDTGEGVWIFPTQGAVDSSPVLVGDKVIVGSDDGRLYLVSLEKGEEIWSFEIGEAVKASPAVARGRIIVGAEDGFIYAFEPAG
jgi:outer membrane protein assembly factor BamB